MKLFYEKTKYVVDNTLAIKTWADLGEGIEPYGDVTVNLSGYGIIPEEGHIFLPKYKMSDEYFENVCSDIVDEVLCPVQIGYGIGFYAKLKPDWEQKVELLKR